MLIRHKDTYSQMAEGKAGVDKKRTNEALSLLIRGNIRPEITYSVNADLFAHALFCFLNGVYRNAKHIGHFGVIEPQLG